MNRTAQNFNCLELDRIHCRIARNHSELPIIYHTELLWILHRSIFREQNCSESSRIEQNITALSIYREQNCSELQRILLCWSICREQNCSESLRIEQNFTAFVYLSGAELLRITQDFTSLVHLSGAELLGNCSELLGIPIPDIVLCYLYIRSPSFFILVSQICIFICQLVW